MVQIHILQICWQEEIGNELKTFMDFAITNAERLDAMNEEKLLQVQLQAQST